MTKTLTVGLVGAVLAGTLTFVAASAVKPGPITEADALPAYEVVTTVRAMGLNPITEPVRRGPYYVLQAYDARGVEMRVVADAQLGDILSVAPAPGLNAQNYRRGPRIIHVPQADDRDNDRDDRASADDRHSPAAANDDDDDEETAPPPRRRPKPAARTAPRRPSHSDAAPVPRQRRSDAPPPPSGPSRALLSAPPPRAEGPTPIRPTPQFNARADTGEKFSQPRDARSNASPPPGYAPPSALPEAD